MKVTPYLVSNYSLKSGIERFKGEEMATRNSQKTKKKRRKARFKGEEKRPSAAHEITCPYCGKVRVTYRRNAVYCSVAHYNAAYYARRTANGV